MLQSSFHLDGALDIDATSIHLPRQANYRLPTTWAVQGHLKRLFVPFSSIFQDLDDRRNDLARLFNDHHVPFTNVFSPNLISVVECGPGNGRSADQYRIKIGDRS